MGFLVANHQIVLTSADHTQYSIGEYERKGKNCIKLFNNHSGAFFRRGYILCYFDFISAIRPDYNIDFIRNQLIEAKLG